MQAEPSKAGGLIGYIGTVCMCPGMCVCVEGGGGMRRVQGTGQGGMSEFGAVHHRGGAGCVAG